MVTDIVYLVKETEIHHSPKEEEGYLSKQRQLCFLFGVEGSDVLFLIMQSCFFHIMFSFVLHQIYWTYKNLARTTVHEKIELDITFTLDEA